MPEPPGVSAPAADSTPWASTHGRKTASGIAYVFLADALILPTGLITAAFLTRNLGPESYGLFTLATVLVSWAEWSITSIFSRATIRFVGNTERWQAIATKVLQAYVISGIALSIALALAAGPVAILLSAPLLAGYLAMAAIDIPLFSLGQAYINILVGVGEFRRRALPPVGRWLGRLVLMLAFVGMGFSVPGAIAGNIGASIIEIMICRRGLRVPFFQRSDFPARHLVGFAVPLFVFALSLRLFDKLDLLMLKAFGGTAAQAGFYGAAQNLSLMPWIFSAAVSTLLLSTLTRLKREGDEAGARQMAADGLRAMLALLPLAAMAAGAAGEIVEAIFGPAFADAGPPLRFLIFAGVGLGAMNVANAILTASDRPVLSVFNALPLLPLAVIGHAIVIPHHGAVGAAIVTSALALAGAAVSVALVGWTCRALPPLGTWIRSVIIGVCAFGVAHSWSMSNVWLVPKLALVSAGVVIAFGLLGELSAAERRLVRSVALTRLGRR